MIAQNGSPLSAGMVISEQGNNGKKTGIIIGSGDYTFEYKDYDLSNAGLLH
jgi:hypothetical protein